MRHEVVGQAVLAEAEFHAVAAIMMSEARIGLSPAKRGMIQSRLARRLRACELDNFPDYLKLVE
ncbi:hypothetical protein ACSNOK_35430, partial [Streptomyces sp. URMC 126]|uniref:hypothetical protein n=1 Tax=Streptomyces sp. URMC 126 TaxID=3423401 RepID=UPI003F1C57F3